MLFYDGFILKSSCDGERAGNHSLLFFAFGLYRDILKFFTDVKRIFNMSLQHLVEGVLRPHVFIFIGSAAGAHVDVKYRGAFGKLGMFQVTTKADAVFEYLFFFPAFNTKHDHAPEITLSG